MRKFLFCFLVLTSWNLSFSQNKLCYKLKLSSDKKWTTEDMSLWVTYFSKADYFEHNADSKQFFFLCSKPINNNILKAKLEKVVINIDNITELKEKDFIQRYEKMTTAQKEIFSKEVAEKTEKLISEFETTNK